MKTHFFCFFYVDSFYISGEGILPILDKKSLDWECLAKYDIFWVLKLWFNN